MKQANKLRAVRKAAGITQMALAAKSGVGIATVNRLELYPLNLQLETALKLAAALGVEVGDVFPAFRGGLKIWA